MFPWLPNPHADYVLAAYGLALMSLIVFAFFSWQQARRQNRLWEKDTQDQRDKTL